MGCHMVSMVGGRDEEEKGGGEKLKKLSLAASIPLGLVLAMGIFSVV